jgi:hypothetical protein
MFSNEFLFGFKFSLLNEFNKSFEEYIEIKLFFVRNSTNFFEPAT